MFALGIGEALDAQATALVRHSVVWLGGTCGETSAGLPATHPLCVLLLRVLANSNFVGTWLTCRQAATLRDFERKALLMRLSRADWVVDSRQTETIRAHRAVTALSPWPYTPNPALPWPQQELLVVGSHIEYSTLDCASGASEDGVRAVRSEALALQSSFSQALLASQSYAVCVGRTQTDNSPGISMIGPPGLWSPEGVIGAEEILAIHRGADVGRAWSYARVA